MATRKSPIQKNIEKTTGVSRSTPQYRNEKGQMISRTDKIAGTKDATANRAKASGDKPGVPAPIYSRRNMNEVVGYRYASGNNVSVRGRAV